MFGFIDMLGTYEQRKVCNTVVNEAIIDTASVTDNLGFPFETGISHPSYYEGKWIIVEQYQTKKRSSKRA